MASEENQRRNLKRRREPLIDGSSTSSTDSNSNTTIKSLEMEWAREDIKLLKKVLLDYSCGEDHWLHRSKYLDEIFLTAITEEYNKRANKVNIAEGYKKIPGRHVDGIILKITELQTDYFIKKRMQGKTKSKSPSPSPHITCMACQKGKTDISEQRLKIKERLSLSISLSDGSHKRQKTNSFETVDKNLGQAVEIGGSSHDINALRGDRAVAVARLLDNLWQEKLLSNEEYHFLLSTRTLVEGLWPETLLDTNYTKDTIVSKLKGFYQSCKKGKQAYES